MTVNQASDWTVHSNQCCTFAGHKNASAAFSRSLSTLSSIIHSSLLLLHHHPLFCVPFILVFFSAFGLSVSQLARLHKNFGAKFHETSGGGAPPVCVCLPISSIHFFLSLFDLFLAFSSLFDYFSFLCIFLFIFFCAFMY